MPDYSQSKIYKVVNNSDDNCYVGSTTSKYLSQRFGCHTNDYRRWKRGQRTFVSIFSLFDTYGTNNCRIVLLEQYPCSTRSDLCAREEYWRNRLITSAVNKVKAFMDPVIRKMVVREYNKQYASDYYKKHREELLQRQKRYHKLQKDEINERRKRKITCKCGTTLSVICMAQHKRSIKHNKWITDNVTPIEFED